VYKYEEKLELWVSDGFYRALLNIEGDLWERI
jgi:hypothetical protein